MKRIGCFLLLVLTIVSVLFVSGCGEDYKKGESLKIVSSNVSSLTPEAKTFDLFKTKSGEEADVICLQEINSDWSKLVLKYLATKGDYDLFGFSSLGNDISSLEESGDVINLIAYNHDKYEFVESDKFWLSMTMSTPSCVLSNGETGDMERCVNWVKLKNKESGREFAVVCFQFDKESDSARFFSSQLMIDEICSFVAVDIPTFIVGDISCDQVDEPYVYLTQFGFTDANTGITSGTEFCFYTGDYITVSEFNEDYINNIISSEFTLKTPIK